MASNDEPIASDFLINDIKSVYLFLVSIHLLLFLFK